MPEPRDREAFLRAVADAVDLQPGEVGEVLEELASHLSDAADGWRRAGYDPSDAERRAIRSLGDPVELGRELGRARHRRRQLLAAAGGAVFSALGLGAVSFVVVGLLAAAVVLCSLYAFWAVVQVTGLQYSGWLTGSVANVGTVVLAALWFGWLGWALPARVARRAGRSVRGVRGPVAVLGFLLGSAMLWTLFSTEMDWVLAVGLPFTPIAFLLAALRPSPRIALVPRTTARQRLAVLAVAVAATTAVGFASAAPRDAWWSGDFSALGGNASRDPVLSGAGWGIDWGDVTGSGTGQFAAFVTGDGVSTAALAERYPTFRLEAWPVVRTDHRLVLGAAPLAASSVPVSSETDVRDLVLPVLRTPVEVEFAAVLVARDGSRVLLGATGPTPTPPWRGTLLDWWLGAG